MNKLLRKKPAKDDREKWILLGLVELYLKTGKPIGSNTLREHGFSTLSSATIRNYFSSLENLGFLRQQHSSGGRIPTPLAYKVYAQSIAKTSPPNKEEKLRIESLFTKESREVASFLQEAAEKLSELTTCAVFLSAPRFDQDFILDVRILNIDHHRCLCALITDFGLIHTEVLYTEKKLSSFSCKRIESYFHARLTKQVKPALSPEELKIAEKFYQEIMLRRIASYAHFTSEDIYRTGFSELIGYPDFNDATILAGGLALFENTVQLRSILNECSRIGSLNCWIGEDLSHYASGAGSCSVIAVPYKINQIVAGSIAILGPNRIPYQKLFGIMQLASECISETLTRSLYKFKISFRLPSQQAIETKNESLPYLLIEDQRGRTDHA